MISSYACKIQHSYVAATSHLSRLDVLFSAHAVRSEHQVIIACMHRQCMAQPEMHYTTAHCHNDKLLKSCMHKNRTATLGAFDPSRTAADT